jgi:hypothetical protein
MISSKSRADNKSQFKFQFKDDSDKDDENFF